MRLAIRGQLRLLIKEQHQEKEKTTSCLPFSSHLFCQGGQCSKAPANFCMGTVRLAPSSPSTHGQQQAPGHISHRGPGEVPWGLSIALSACSQSWDVAVRERLNQASRWMELLQTSILSSRKGCATYIYLWWSVFVLLLRTREWSGRTEQMRLLPFKQAEHYLHLSPVSLWGSGFLEYSEYWKYNKIVKRYYSVFDVLPCFYLFPWPKMFTLAQLTYWDYFAHKNN